MRSTEFITESTAEDRELIMLANAIGEYVLTITKPQGKIAGAVNSFFGPMFDDAFKFDHASLRIKSIPLPKFKEQDIITVVNYYCVGSTTTRPELNDSIATCSTLGYIYLNMSKVNAKNIFSVLVHELRHAVDNVKQKDANIAGTSSMSLEEYLVNTAEINARFTQALMDINNLLPLPKEQLTSTINYYFHKYELIEVFPNKKNDPRYKQLVKRAVKFFEAQSKSIKSPGFIQKIIKFITAGLL